MFLMAIKVYSENNLDLKQVYQMQERNNTKLKYLVRKKRNQQVQELKLKWNGNKNFFIILNSLE